MVMKGDGYSDTNTMPSCLVGMDEWYAVCSV